jgi:elongation factor P hydroxylase
VPYNRIVFAHGFYASGLHEISHWCIAGKRVASWWISATGTARTAAMHDPVQFEDVEVKPQALDWLFCVAAGFPFNVSCDNWKATSSQTALPSSAAFMRR